LKFKVEYPPSALASPSYLWRQRFLGSRLSASRSRCLTLHEHIANLARLMRHRPAPMAKAAVGVDGLRPFVTHAATAPLSSICCF
jgi:hypothetical protein